MPPSKLDQVVKGAPTTNNVADIVSAERAAELYESKRPESPLSPSDPLSTLPSSPPQIYLNLLILEASLRAQYLALQTRRRQHTFFLTLLGLWNIYYTWAVFLRPREDGQGRGGSVYWVVDMAEKVAFMGGVITAMLIWATGQWERGVRWPRRWVGTTNRGLRGMNLKIVILKGPWWRRLLLHFAFLLPVYPFVTAPGSNYRFVESHEKGTSRDALGRQRQYRSGVEEDVSPGGNYVKLLLLPKSFSPAFRENWELYRSGYWERENERRGELRKALKRSDRELARQQGGWLWWTGWRGFKHAKAVSDVEKMHRSHHTTHHRESDRPRRRRGSLSQNDSRSSSRSSLTPTPDPEDGPRRSRRIKAATNAANTKPTRRLSKLHESDDADGDIGSSMDMGSADAVGLGLTANGDALETIER